MAKKEMTKKTHSDTYVKRLKTRIKVLSNACNSRDEELNIAYTEHKISDGLFQDAQTLLNEKEDTIKELEEYNAKLKESVKINRAKHRTTKLDLEAAHEAIVRQALLITSNEAELCLYASNEYEEQMEEE